ncbi:unnamed protein product [Rangifer tarandus platyrhynchus]|uniref:Uncharacterized protein n=1 Tax=Rangifer tarandus platyrhynchus TaxID=3082113 RepID=A0AC59Y736_RANTA
MEFVFLAYPSQSEPRALAFLGASLVYTWVITRNVLIMVAIQAEARLHTPMYYFLGSLSGVEIGYTAAVVPHLLANTLRAEKTITLLGCATQMGFFIGLGDILDVMDKFDVLIWASEKAMSAAVASALGHYPFSFPGGLSAQISTCLETKRALPRTQGASAPVTRHTTLKLNPPASSPGFAFCL